MNPKGGGPQRKPYHNRNFETPKLSPLTILQYPAYSAAHYTLTPASRVHNQLLVYRAAHSVPPPVPPASPANGVRPTEHLQHISHVLPQAPPAQTSTTFQYLYRTAYSRHFSTPQAQQKFSLWQFLVTVRHQINSCPVSGKISSGQCMRAISKFVLGN